ncbi:flavin reductase (NADPH) [Anoplophora glabripennis]|uniref:Flavin reductase (NADPH) n=1 Tax=Anoplophora glabripennis TaxID=217634 RepID=V5GS29_ANOGL|nr:flavin reductase (NADPH) [Anoplophora glabripennis]
MDKVLIFGSTGMTGICTVEAAVQKGLNVRAFVRDPSKLPDHLRNSVEVVQGNVLEYKDVLNAIRGVTGVVVVLGTGTVLTPTTDLSEGMKNIVKAMKELNVEIVSVCLSAFLFFEPEKVPPMFRDVTADHQREYDVLKESGLKYIAVFPPHITDQPGTEYEVQYDASPGRVISKHDLGRFLVDSLTLPEHYGRACGVCTKR